MNDTSVTTRATRCNRRLYDRVHRSRKRYNNCGIQSSEQLIHQITGDFIDEETLLDKAIEYGYTYDRSKVNLVGSTSAEKRTLLLHKFGITSIIIDNPTTVDLSDALKNNKGVIAAIESSTLWNDPLNPGGHAVVITEGDFDERGNLTHVYINDTGNGKQGRRMKISEMMKCFSDYDYPSINVTTEPIWTQTRYYE